MPWYKRLFGMFDRADSAWGFLSSDLLRPVTLPLGAGLLTMGSAILGAVPLPYLLAASFLAAASMATMLVRVDEWWSRVNPSGKLSFAGLLIAPDIQANTELDGKLKAIQLGFELHNQATFPIKWQIEKIYTQFAGRVQSKKDYDLNVIHEVPANGQLWFRDASIPLDINLETRLMEGEVTFKVAYWKSDKRKFYYERKFLVHGSIDTSNRTFAASWTDA